MSHTAFICWELEVYNVKVIGNHRCLEHPTVKSDGARHSCIVSWMLVQLSRRWEESRTLHIRCTSLRGCRNSSQDENHKRPQYIDAEEKDWRAFLADGAW